MIEQLNTARPDRGGTIITGESIPLFRVLALRGALRLEAAGMHRRGRSVFSIVKEEFGFKGNKARVLSQLNAYIEALN